MTPTAASRKTEAPPARKILVVGDWVVDEHWVTGIHRSPTSSRTGRAHYRALHRRDDSMESIGGVGRTASVLFMAKTGEDLFAEIVGVGIWGDGDSDDHSGTVPTVPVAGAAAAATTVPDGTPDAEPEATFPFSPSR